MQGILSHEQIRANLMEDATLKQVLKWRHLNVTPTSYDYLKYSMLEGGFDATLWLIRSNRLVACTRVVASADEGIEWHALTEDDVEPDGELDPDEEDWFEQVERTQAIMRENIQLVHMNALNAKASFYNLSRMLNLEERSCILEIRGTGYGNEVTMTQFDYEQIRRHIEQLGNHIRKITDVQSL